MDSDRFDALARTVSAITSRRGALAALLAALGAPFLSTPDTTAQRRKKNGKDRDNTKDKDKNANRDGGGGKGQRGSDRKKKRKSKSGERRQEVRAAAPRRCFNGTSCIPGPGRNLSKCNFGGSTALRNKNLRGANLGGANLTGADVSGADFTGANLGNACLVNTNFTDATFSGSTNTAGAVFCGAIMPDGSTNNSGCDQPTRCCETCTQLGAACTDTTAPCCNGGECAQGICRCPAGQRECPDGSCHECCVNGSRDTCGAGEICCDFMCRSGDCCENDDCPPGEPICIDNTCSICTRNDQCGGDEICCGGTCQVGNCCPTAGPTAGEAQTCTVNQTCCAIGCVNLNTNRNNCGECGNRCPANARNCCGGDCRECCNNNDCPQGEQCDMGTCVPVTCGGPCVTTANCSGVADCICCTGSCVTGECCSDLDCRNPTPVCNSDNVCVACDDTSNPCNVDEVCCGGSCFEGVCCDDGGCAQFPNAPHCEGNECVCDANSGAPCDLGLTCCATGCENLQTDPDNCGSCGNACPAGQPCVGGTCGCPPDRPNHCIDNTCQACCVSAQCSPDFRPICDRTSRTCRACRNDDECMASDQGTRCCGGACVFGDCCGSDDCPDLQPVCGANHVCRPCQSNGECEPRANLCGFTSPGLCSCGFSPRCPLFQECLITTCSPF